MLRKSFWAQTPSYCVVSIGGASLDVVKNDIDNHLVKNKLINQ